MATLTIGDKTVTVDDSFKSLSPEQQNATVEEIAASLGLNSPKQPDLEESAPDPEIAKYTGEVLSGDPNRARAAIVKDEFERAPTLSKAATAVKDIVRLGVDGLTIGFGDKIAAAVPEIQERDPNTGELPKARSYDARLADTRQQTEDARSRAGGAGLVAEIGGSVAGAGKILGVAEAGAKAIPAAARAISAVKGATGVGGVAARSAGAAATGAGLGALNAAGHDENVGEGAAYGAIGGAIGAPVGEAAAKTFGKIAGMFGKKPKVMALDELAAAKTAAYKASDDAGVIIKPSFTQRLSQEVKEDLANFGYRERLQPGVKGVLDELDDMAGQNVTLKGMDGFRQVVGLMGKSEKPAERDLARQIIKKIDKHLDDLKTGDIDVLTGNANVGVQALQTARKLHASQRKTEMIQDAVDRAERQASKGGSGGNVDNALRQQFDRILNNKKLSRGLTGDERAAMELIVRGVKGEKLLRSISKLSPNGNGLMTFLQGTGAYASGGATLPFAAGGIGAKMITDPLTQRRVAQLERVIRGGGSASSVKKAENAAQRLAAAARPALRGAGLTTGAISAPAFANEIEEEYTDQ